MAEKKISFGFSKSIKPKLLSGAPTKIDNSVELIKCLEGQTIKIIGEVKKEEKPLIIPLKNSTKTSAALAALQTLKDTIEGNETTVTENVENKIIDNIVDDSKTLEQRAAHEILNSLKERQDFDEDANKIFSLPLKVDELPLEGAVESTLNDYEDIPISQFGMAMLRGMGFKDDVKSDKKIGFDEPMVRPKGLGLGADKLVKPKTLLVPPAKDEVLEFKKNACVRILLGKHKDMYGQSYYCIMKLYILFALTWNFSNSLEYCHIRENGNELYLDCRQDDMERIHVIRDRSVSCGDENVLRENIITIRIDRCSFNDFDLFKKCTTLHLFHVDEVKSIQKEKLIEMDQLMYITFAYTNPENLAWVESSFSVLPNLREIECIGYNLTTVKAFQFSNQLKKLRYSVENSSVSSLPVGMFRNLNQLEVLLLDLSEISNFSAIDFTGLENLKQLDFNTNQMSDLIENRSIPKTLRYLSLQNNHLRGIVSVAVLPNLIYLDLSLNEIDRIAANIFSGLTNLRSLQLNDNSINRIESGAFTSLKNLKKLNCGMNKLTALDEHTFKGLHNLRYLNLEDNRISIINVDTFSALTNLVQINLSEQDGLTAVDLNAFPQFVNLHTKTVIYNEIKDELDDFEMNEREWLKIILSYSNNDDETDSMCANMFQSFWIPDQDDEIDLQNLTEYMRNESLILGNLDLSYNRITSVNIDKSS